MRTLLVILALVLAPSLALADKAGPASDSVKKANDTLDGLLKQKPPAPNSPEEKKLAGQVTESLRGFLDIDELGKRAMVDHWKDLKKEQQDQFLAALRGLIEANYVKGLRSNLDYGVDYTGESADKDGNITVTTQIKAERKKKPYKIEVDYIVVKSGATYKAWDVKTDGVGLVENYRAMFNKIIEREKFEGLIKRMQDKQSKL